jgi:hypothetical protein
MDLVEAVIGLAAQLFLLAPGSPHASWSCASASRQTQEEGLIA